jgi:recombination protein RecA
VERDIVDKSGAWYSYNKERIGQGKDNARQFLKENPAIAADIESRIRAISQTHGLPVAPEDDASEMPEEAEA